uniref:Retinol-binding protein 4-A-like n=1 Tax=Crassostrea virginica TaxID=6565 RepID=A0A8B8A6J0_CRAVI|nr:retinol-binding protein 4-A-like [Crassostrea virginica]
MTSWVILPLASLLALFLAGSPARAQTGTCPPVSNIPVQTGFDFDRFANGTRWNVIQYNKIIPIEGLDMEVVKSDVSLMFSRDPNDTMTVNLAGRVRLASSLAFCLKLEGTVEEGNPEHPGKLRQSYYNPLKDQYLQFNFWVLYTDYDNLTVVYACEKTLGDGTCDPGSTFIWTLSRGTSQSPAQKTKVQELSSSVCLDVASLRQMNHTTACPMT